MLNLNVLLKLPLFFCIFITSACLKPEEAPKTPTSSKNIELRIQGLSTFGSILLGEVRQTNIIIKNNSDSQYDLPTEMGSSFSIVRTTPPCTQNKIPARGSCTSLIQFSPDVVGQYVGRYTVGDSFVELSGNGIIGGDISLSEKTIEMGPLASGVEYIKTITLTNVGDFTVNFPTFTLPEGYKIISNYCGGFINSRRSCDIKFEVIKKTLGPHSDIILMSSTSRGSGTVITQIVFNSLVSPGVPSGEIGISTILPSFDATIQSDELFTTFPILDNYGNVVSDGTPVSVSLVNLALSESTNVFYTQNGRISFKIKSTTTKGPASITLISGNSFGLISLYVKAGLPFGGLSLQPYDPILIADGSTGIFLKTEKIYDKNKNLVEDGTEIEVSTSSGSLSTDKLIYTSTIRVKTFDGIARFHLKSGETKGPVSLSLRSNPLADTFLAQGLSAFEFIPGFPAGIIPINSARESINALNEFTTVTVGPVVDRLGNIVANNTPIDLLITNGRTVDDNYSFMTDQEGKFQFILVGSGNRGPINITAKSFNASGLLEVWAYKNTHLTFQGQKRDDWGIGTGSNKINSGRAYVLTAKGTHTDYVLAKNNLPSVSLKGNEIFDYQNLASNDSIFYRIQKMSRSPVSTLGRDGGLFPVEVPSPVDGLPSVDGIVFFPERKSIPDFNADVFYSAGTKFMSAPFWTKSVVTPGTNIFGCGDTESDQFGNYQLNGMQFSPTVGEYSCKVSDVFVTSNSPLDRLNQISSDLHFSNFGYVEDPIGCSFEEGQSPVYTFSIGEFTKNSTIEKIIEISNPSLLTAQNIVFSFAEGTQQNWIIEPVSCGQELLPGETCSIRVRFGNTNATIPGTYSSILKLSSSITPVDVNLNLQVTGNTTSTGVSGGIIGRVDLKSNCFTKLAVFGGHNYVYTNARREDTRAKTSNLLSLFSGRGQSIAKYDNKCSGESTEQSCLTSGFGCRWNQESLSCEEKLNLGSFPPSGISLSPMVPVGRKIYMFSGFDPSGDGKPLTNGLIEYNSESELWLNQDIDNNESNIPEGETFNPKYFSPEIRYMHGLTYIPELTSLYLYGGVGSGGRKLNDIWKLNLYPKPILDESTGELIPQNRKWELVCLDCSPLPGESIFNTLIKRIFEGPGLTPGEEPHSSYLVWNREKQRLYFFFKDRSEVYSMDPLSSNPKGTIVAVEQESGLSEFGGSRQIVYNQKLGRYLGYFKSSFDGTNYFKLMDQDPEEKAYLRVRFYIGAPSKRFGTVLTPRILAYGSSGGDITGSCGVRCGGIKAYIFDHDSKSWFEFGDNTSLSRQQLSQNGEISFSFNDEDARSMISSDGYVDLLVTTKGSPTEFNQMALDSIFLDGTF